MKYKIQKDYYEEIQKLLKTSDNIKKQIEYTRFRLVERKVEL